jgi:membrane protease YdiL (CAAX protease family)
VVKVFKPEPLQDAGINCGVYFVVMLATVILDRLYPFKTALTCVLVIVPYLLLIAFILVRKFLQRPDFPVGNPAQAIATFFLIWAGGLLVAIIFAYNDGLFSPLTVVGKLNHIGTILEEPVAQELVFRGALLTSLQQTKFGRMKFYKIELSVLMGAVIFSVLHAIIFFAAGFSFSDVMVTALTSLILSTAYGWIYTKTENVWYGVFAHILVNFGRWG